MILKSYPLKNDLRILYEYSRNTTKIRMIQKFLLDKFILEISISWASVGA